jgi:hypothetical protein
MSHEIPPPANYRKNQSFADSFSVESDGIAAPNDAAGQVRRVNSDMSLILRCRGPGHKRIARQAILGRHHAPGACPMIFNCTPCGHKHRRSFVGIIF